MGTHTKGNGMDLAAAQRAAGLNQALQMKANDDARLVRLNLQRTAGALLATRPPEEWADPKTVMACAQASLDLMDRVDHACAMAHEKALREKEAATKGEVVNAPLIVSG